MKFGQLIVTKSRKSHYCRQCKEDIPIGEVYWGLDYWKTNKGKTVHETTRVHKSCWFAWIETSISTREDKEKKRRFTENIPMGRPGLELNLNNSRERKNQFIYLARFRKRLVQGYIDKDWDSVKRAKRNISGTIKKLVDNQEEWGPPGEIRLAGQHKEMRNTMSVAMVNMEEKSHWEKLNDIDYSNTDGLLEWLDTEEGGSNV